MIQPRSRGPFTLPDGHIPSEVLQGVVVCQPITTDSTDERLGGNSLRMNFLALLPGQPTRDPSPLMSVTQLAFVGCSIVVLRYNERVRDE